MKKITLLTVMFLFFMCFQAHGAVIGTTDEEVKYNAEPMLDDIMNGLNSNDYNKYAKDFDATLKEAITVEKFHEVRETIIETLGSYLYSEYLGFVNKNKFTIAFWKGSFDKTEDEILIKLVVSKRGGDYLVTGLWFE